jgi:hypothetical protein
MFHAWRYLVYGLTTVLGASSNGHKQDSRSSGFADGTYTYISYRLQTALDYTSYTNSHVTSTS